MPRAKKGTDQAPPEFAVDRTLPLGRHSILQVFPGLDKLPPFRAIGKLSPKGVDSLRTVGIELIAEDIWMYVAPRVRAKDMPKRWDPVFSGEDDVIVVGRGHLEDSDGLLLYLDILHELCHIAQRHRGLELWDRSYEYVDRPTEIEAYEFAVEEARRLGVSETFLREYLKVEWVSDRDHLRLLDRMGLSKD